MERQKDVLSGEERMWSGKSVALPSARLLNISIECSPRRGAGLKSVFTAGRPPPPPLIYMISGPKFLNQRCTADIDKYSLSTTDSDPFYSSTISRCRDIG
ncbi:hypothetical protein J6590_040129 [Homalodisca vitripennis]|nr:hypothetical protein J6590_040129 [Homalodisca vitripennis]